METFFAIAFVAAIAVGVVSRIQRGTVWRGVASDFGLRFSNAGVFSSPRISGYIDDIFVDARLIHQNKATYTQVMVEFPPGPTIFRITKATEIGSGAKSRLPGELYESLTGDDVEIGDTAFDKLAKIDGEPGPLAAFLTRERVEAVSYLLETYPSTRITDSEIRLQLMGNTRSANRLSRGLVDAITAAQAMHPRRTPRTPPAKPTPESDDTAELPGPAKRGLHRPTRRRQHTPEDRVPYATAIPHRGGSAQSDARRMADELFASGATSPQAERLFRSRYLGMPINWGGYILRARPGETILKVAEIDDPLFGRSAVTVVSDANAGEGVEVGQHVTLDGIVHGLNHLERTIYVDSAVVQP